MGSGVFEAIIIIILTNLVTFHVTRVKFRKNYQEVVEGNFDKLQEKIEIMLEASFVTNGYGSKFRDNYLRLLKDKKTAKDLELKNFNN